MADGGGSSGSAVRRLLGRVAARNDLARLGARWRLALLVFAAVYALLFLAARLLALLPDFFEPVTLLAPPAAALAAALLSLLGRRTSPREAGRLVDSRMNTEDLFLTVAMLGGPAFLPQKTQRPQRGKALRSSAASVVSVAKVGEFRPLVEIDAEERAAAVRPALVVPFRWLPGARNAALALAALFMALVLLPQLDPFGRHEERGRASRRRKRLEETVRATAARAKVLKQKEKAGDADRKERAIADLKRAFKEMKPGKRQANLKRLSVEQKELGELWRRLGEKKLRDALNQMPTFQRFGRADAGKLSEWKRELAKGKTGGLDREIADLKELAKKLGRARDAREKERLRREMRRRLRELAEFASSEANSKRLSDAVKRALAQLEMSGEGGLGGEALQGLMESMELTQQEIADLARSARELQRLEDALEACQFAKAANAGKGLDGRGCGGCSTLADYAEFYRRLLEEAGGGRGAGPGMRGPGTGKGGLASEDDGLETSFKTELSKSSLTAGRMLLKWKTKGLSDPGRAREDYAERVREVKQGWSEAVIRERVPPGYHDAIRKYFDTLSEGRGDGAGTGVGEGGARGREGGEPLKEGGEGGQP